MTIRPTLRLASALALVLLAVGLIGAPAAQAAAFRYWTYWHAPSGTWVFATDGPAAHVPADGTVEGWRFAVTTQSGSSDQPPSITPSFDELCGSTAEVSGSKRVGLVVDPGPAAIAPKGEVPPATIAACVLVPEDATGFDVLSKMARVKTDGGLICSLAAYPATECAPVLGDDEAQAIAQAVAQKPPTAAPTVSAVVPVTTVDPGSPLPTIAVAVLLLVGAGIGAVVYRRRDHRG